MVETQIFLYLNSECKNEYKNVGGTSKGLEIEWCKKLNFSFLTNGPACKCTGITLQLPVKAVIYGRGDTDVTKFEFPKFVIGLSHPKLFVENQNAGNWAKFHAVPTVLLPSLQLTLHKNSFSKLFLRFATSFFF